MGVIRLQLQSDGLSENRINNLLRPEDRQNVKLAYDLLREIWRLPSLDSSSGKSVRFIENRAAMRFLGSLFRHLIFPYICTSLSLMEQLRHLSAAAHLLLALTRKTDAGARFMPTQLYIDLMLMIKNVFFCVAKTQVDCPDGNFWLILLGTDRLETLFGILRTMVGSDSNVDLLQLALRITGTTEVATILAKYPHWDSAPRRLKLPILSGDDIEIEQKQDHITPEHWIGDTAMSSPNFASVLQELSDEKAAGKDINILQPFGEDIIHAERAADDIDDSAEDYVEPGASATPADPLDPAPEPFREDAVAEDDTEQKYSPTFSLGGKEVYKGRWLNQIFRDYRNPHAGSRDRLKRVASLPRYMVQTETTYASIIRSDDHPDGPEITLDLPIISFVQCEEKYFVCIGEVTDLHHNDEHHTSLSTDLLLEPSTTVTFQLLHIHPALQSDDTTGKNDWIWKKGRGKTFSAPGRLVELIDPDVHVAEGQCTHLLFDSQDILAVGAMLFGRMTAADGPKIGTISRSHSFPYKNHDEKLCFLCEDPEVEREIARIGACAYCVPAVKVGTKIPDILNHNAAHILFNPAIKAEHQPCGLCLRPFPQCTFVLKGSSPEFQVDGKKSNCPAYTRFAYQKASISEPNNPSSNVPVPCPATGCRSVVWRYNLKAHFHSQHPGQAHAVYEDLATISATEKGLLKALWTRRHAKRLRNSKKSKAKKPIEDDVSERHKTSRAIRTNEEPDADDEPAAPREDDTWSRSYEPDTDNEAAVSQEDNTSSMDSDSEFPTELPELHDDDDEEIETTTPLLLVRNSQDDTNIQEAILESDQEANGLLPRAASLAIATLNSSCWSQESTEAQLQADIRGL
ncbi:hypothetical protein MSAN_02030000 [Mycena sanguinolenta]|uniref:Uncharacterized protein n=1 Tax=Mycena sanguinolenta TaxID=230812 RepID=A0A8H6XLK2_9AGAR|nr:hypothetical protein MSAN_02030000 [Mycena sanguinolenta]